MCPVQWIIYLCRGTTCASFSLFGNGCVLLYYLKVWRYDVEYRCTSSVKCTECLVNTSSVLDINLILLKSSAIPVLC
jgi:hypothetical protein